MLTEVLDIYLERPAISPTTIIMLMVFMIMEVLECMWVTEEMDLVLMKPATIPLKTMELIVKAIGVVMTEEVDLGLKRPATLTLSMVEEVLMVMGEVDICIRPDDLPPIPHARVVYCWFNLVLLVLLTKMFMVM